MREKMIREEFRVRVITDEGIERSHEIANIFSDFLDELEELCGATGREMAIVKTKLEEASFFAKKAMCSRVENQMN